MVIHGSISFVRLHNSIDLVRGKVTAQCRCISIVQPTYTVFHSLKYTYLLLAFNMTYASFFAIGLYEFYSLLIKFLLPAPIIGWGRYQKFEYGCCIAFNDSSPNVRSYVITMLIAVLFLPFCKILFL